MVCSRTGDGDRVGSRSGDARSDSRQFPRGEPTRVGDGARRNVREPPGDRGPRRAGPPCPERASPCVPPRRACLDHTGRGMRHRPCLTPATAARAESAAREEETTADADPVAVPGQAHPTERSAAQRRERAASRAAIAPVGRHRRGAAGRGPPAWSAKRSQRSRPRRQAQPAPLSPNRSRSRQPQPAQTAAGGAGAREGGRRRRTAATPRWVPVTVQAPAGRWWPPTSPDPDRDAQGPRPAGLRAGPPSNGGDIAAQAERRLRRGLVDGRPGPSSRSTATTAVRAELFHNFRARPQGTSSARSGRSRRTTTTTPVNGNGYPRRQPRGEPVAAPIQR